MKMDMEIKGKNVLVTGATGFLGGTLALKLADQGASVRALARSLEKAVFLKNNKNIEVVKGDITNPERMREVAIGCDYVFHVAALVGASVKNGDLAHFRKINVGGTRSVMEAAIAAKALRVVYVSTILVYGYPSASEISEETAICPGSDSYSISKAEGEAVVQEYAIKHNMSFSIVRPGAIYGPGGKQWTERVFKLARLRPVFWIGSGKGASLVIYIEDLVALMIKVVLHPRAHQQAFNAISTPNPTMREYVLGYAKLVGHQSWLGIPIPLVKLFAPIISFFSHKNSLLKDLPIIIEWLNEYKNYKMTKAHELLDWHSKVNYETGIQNCIPWLQEQNLLK